MVGVEHERLYPNKRKKKTLALLRSRMYENKPSIKVLVVTNIVSDLSYIYM